MFVRVCVCVFFFFINYPCRKYFKPIIVQYYIYKCVSWVPGLTLLNLCTIGLMNLLSEWNSFICRRLTGGIYICVYIYIYIFQIIFIQSIIRYYIQFPVLYSESFLLIYFMYSSLYLLISYSYLFLFFLSLLVTIIFFSTSMSEFLFC